MQILKIYIFLVIVSLTSICSLAYSQVGTPFVTHFSKSDYQGGTQNWDIIQQHNNYIFIGNNKGLLVFDGADWNIRPLPNKTIVRSIKVHQNGVIYIGGQDEIGFLDQHENGEFFYNSLKPLIPENYQNFDDVWDILVDNDRVVFCTQQKLFIYENGAFQIVPVAGTRLESYFNHSGKLIFQDFNNQLFYLNENNLDSLQWSTKFNTIHVTSLLPLNQDSTLVVSKSSGLFIWDNNQLSYLDSRASDRLKTYRTFCGIHLKDSRFAIGTPQNGLLIINSKGVVLMHLNTSNALQNNTVLSLFQDNESNLWLGLDNGIDYVEINSPFSRVGSEIGIEGTGYVSTLYDNKWYFGTNQGVFAIPRKRLERGLSNGRYAFEVSPYGQVWSFNHLEDQFIIGLHEGAIQVDDKQTSAFSSVNGVWKIIPLQSDPEYALMGTYAGFYLLKKDDKTSRNNWRLVKKLNGFEESARVIARDANGYIWVSHAYKGLFRLAIDLEDERIKEVRYFDDSFGLPSDISINVLKIKEEILFTTSDGIYQYEADLDTFVRDSILNQLFGGARDVHRLLEDELGNIWFSIDQEFGMLEVREKGLVNQFDIRFFNQFQDELVDGFEHIYAHDPENIFIASENGFIHFNSLKLDAVSNEFKVILNEVWGLKRDSIIFAGSLLNSKELLNTAILPNKQNALRFSFSAPYFEQFEHVKYRYWLKGYDENWSDWSRKTEKEYTNLHAGDYEFKVQAINAYGVKSTESSFRFMITAPWYATFWAYIIYVLFFCGGVLLIYYRGQKNFKKKTEELKQQQEEAFKRKESTFKEKVEKSEAEIIQLRNEKLKAENTYKTSELASATMHLVQKGELMQKLKKDLKELLSNASKENARKINQLIRTIDQDSQLDDSWNQFELYFDQVHTNFFQRLRQNFPELTPKDQRLCAYLRMNLSTKEIAPLMNISVRGVEISRYRLRKKLELNSEVNLVDFMMKI